MTSLWLALLALCSYGVGGIPFGLLAGKLKGVDIRRHGSGNIGATNAARVLGKRWFFIILLLDASKGLSCALAGHLLAARVGGDAAMAGGLGALAGHLFSPWLRFRGGKGVATGLGVVLVLTLKSGSWVPLPALISLGVFLAVVALTRMISAGSVLAALSLPGAYAWWVFESLPQPPTLGRLIFLSLVAVFVVVKHRSNIKRILRGDESRLGARKAEADSPA